MVAEALPQSVADAARMSNLIEHKGQCTAMRHLVVPKLSEADVESKVYGSASMAESAADSMEAATFFNTLAANPLNKVAPGYKTLPGALSNIAVRHSAELPKSIEEMWREAYLDVTAPDSLCDAFISELAGWLNREQPISLALNVADKQRALKLFERSSLVVYTVGYPEEKPALTCQARPQDGEVFGEVPPRRMLDRVSRFPVVVPSSTPGYNTNYSQDYLRTRGKQPFADWGLPESMGSMQSLLECMKDDARRGYCRELLAYLADAATGPRRGTGQRTALFGLQRPPLGTKACVRLPKGSTSSDDVIPVLLPFLTTNAKDQLVLSLHPSADFPGLDLIRATGISCLAEEDAEFQKTEGSYWNVTQIPHASLQHYPLVSHFTMTLVAFGHIKSTKSDDESFVSQYSQSAKWLRIAAQTNEPETKRARTA